MCVGVVLDQDENAAVSRDNPAAVSRVNCMAVLAVLRSGGCRVEAGKMQMVSGSLTQ